MKLNKSELVSIITPVYNAEKYLPETIESVLAQTYSSWELLLIDDGSTDGSAEIITAYMKIDDRIKSIKHVKNCGAAIARNTGIKFSQGKFIAFVDSDDIWHPHKLRKQITFMKKYNATFSCTSYDRINENGKKLSLISKVKKFKYNYWDVLKDCPGNSTVIYDAKALGKTYIDDIKKRNDYVMWLKIIKKAGTLYALDDVLTTYRVRAGSISSNKFSLIKYLWLIFRKYEKLSYPISLYLIIYMSVNKLLNKR